MNHNHRYEKGEQIMFKMIITSLPYAFFKAVDFIDLYFLDIPKDNTSRRHGVYGFALGKLRNRWAITSVIPALFDVGERFY